MRFFILLFYPLIFHACTIDENKICGHWQAVAFFENGNSVNLSLDSVQLKLLPSHKYQYKSLGLYAESGTWEPTVNYLLLTDTTSTKNAQKFLKIVYQSNDSLKIKMEHEGKEQVLFFKKLEAN